MNKVMLIGNVGREPEVRYYDSDQPCAMFTLATTERGYTLANGTRVPESTEWHNIIAWRGIAKVVERYVHKGDKLYIEGKLKTRHYTDKRGIDRTVTEIYVDEMEMLSPRSKSMPEANSTTAPAITKVTEKESEPITEDNNNEPPF